MRSEFQRFIHNDYTIMVLVETETKVERIQSMLNEMHIPTVSHIHEKVDSGQAIVTEGSLSEGFELPYAISGDYGENFQDKTKETT